MARAVKQPVVLMKWYRVVSWMLDRVDHFPKNQRFVFCAATARPRSHDTSRIAWAKLMARAGEEFPLECPNCGGDIRLREDGRQELVQVKVGGEAVVPDDVEAGTGFFETRLVRGEITPDKANAVWLEIGSFSEQSGGGQGNFLDLAFSAEGQLYGMNNNGTGIHAIDKATAVYGNTAFVIQTAGGTPVTVSTQFAAVPEPGSYALAIPGLLCGLYSLCRRRT